MRELKICVVRQRGSASDSDILQALNLVAAPPGTVSIVTPEEALKRLPTDLSNRHSWSSPRKVAIVCDPTEHQMKGLEAFKARENRCVPLVALSEHELQVA